ncbi:acyltransferase family protein [Gordonia crocea]|uniref:Acyltransferase n=1 Tax=Gordonia crocea TaxID=589162 RepID=A0A7I9V166_9ACTN|nr:acyltransferase family protein [Gordonia crocea]GED99194.1 acyltransferase [Gordonia crocea]
MSSTTTAAGGPSGEPGSKPSGGKPIAYRHDLDGLRGLAIALVAIFHVWFGRVSGGVDVFLTLSGYFFVASLLKHVTATNPSTATWREALNPWPRLSRLLRRLLPALYLVLAGVVLLCWQLMPSTRLGPLGQEVIASALYYQNYLLALNSQNYGAATSAASPMQHLWSMSMQGQFFFATLFAALALGGLLKFAARFDRRFGDPKTIRVIFGVCLLAVALLSFAWANYRHAVNQPVNYYDTLARLWEPLAGALLAIWMPKLVMSRAVRNTLTIVALLLIITSGWWIQGVQEYPGALALVPAGSTLLIIWTGSAATRPATAPAIDVHDNRDVNGLMAQPSMMWLGNIAYSLYLIHWPLLIFFLTWRIKDKATFAEGTAILAVSVLLAWLVTRYVETPLRAGRGLDFSKQYRRILVVGLVIVTIVAGTTSAVWVQRQKNLHVDTMNLDPRLYPGGLAFLWGVPAPHVPPQPELGAAYMDRGPTWDNPPNQKITSWNDDTVRVGVFGDTTATRTIAVAGGSHADMWIPALDVLGRKHHFRVTTYVKVGCALVKTHVFKWYGKERPDCNRWAAKVMKQLAQDKPDVVFTNSTRPTEEEDHRPGDYVPHDYVEIFDDFTARGQKVIAMRDTPWTHLENDWNPPECLATGRKPQVCGVKQSVALAPTDPAKTIAAQFPGITFLDYTKAVCQDGYCPAIVGNILVYRDTHHFTATFARSLAPALEKDLRKSLHWW